MPELETRLHTIGPDAFPATPDLVGAVGARLRAGDRSGATPRRRRAPRGLAIALAALAIPTAAVAAVPGARHAVLELLGLRHVRVERVEHLPQLPRLRTAELGTRVASVAAAAQRAGFGVRTPSALGEPDRVYVAGGIVSLVYDDVLVTELEAVQEPELLKKALVAGTAVEPVSIHGIPGYFFSGAPHEVLYAPRNGSAIRPLPPRLAGNTLAFERNRLIVRIEGRALTKARALELARSISL